MRKFNFTPSYYEWHLTDAETGTLLHVMNDPTDWIYTDDGHSIDYDEIKEKCLDQLDLADAMNKEFNGLYLTPEQTLSKEEMEEASILMADTLYDTYCELDDD
jgi:hypothetical protein